MMLVQLRDHFHCSTRLSLALVVSSLIPIISNASNHGQPFASDKFDFKSVEDFTSFIGVFKMDDIHQVKDKLGAPERFIEDRTAILDLERVVSSQEVCANHKIDELINYHNKYFASSVKSKPITYYFFKKYAIQVAFVCKRNLIENLTKAREELSDNSKVFEEAVRKVFIAEPSLKSNMKLLQDQPSEPASANIKPKDNFELTLTEYREALTKLKRPEDILTFEPDKCKDSKHRLTEVTFDKLQTFLKPALMCHQLHRYYAGSVLSIARLANIGYTALNDVLDNRLMENPMLRDWILAAQVCDPMLHLCTKELRGEWAVVDTCASSVPVIELMVYQDSVNEFDEELLREMVPRSFTSRPVAQKLMKSAIKSMAKAGLMEQIKSGAGARGIFKKSLSMLASQVDTATGAAARQNSLEATAKSRPPTKFSFVLLSEENDLDISKPFNNQAIEEGIADRIKSDEESYRTLMEALQSGTNSNDDRNDIDSAVSFFDPMSTLISFFTVMAIMLSFEWMFFIVMTLAARICHHLYFNFDNLLTFPPKILSWSDADFARLSDQVNKVDEDDYYDYDELNEGEREQRDLLEKVFGKPPPMLYRD